jgi:hypothetical protein
LDCWFYYDYGIDTGNVISKGFLASSLER